MAIEKKWEAIAPRLFTSNGTADGLVTVASTDRFKVKQSVIVKNNLGVNKTLEVKRVPSETQLYVGIPGNIDAREDLSAYTVAAGSTIEAPSQPRATVPEKEFERAVYEEEPTVAKRSVLVDKLGRKIDSTVGDDGLVRLATTSDITVENINVENLDVQMDAFGTPPDSALSVGSENGQVSGTKHVFVNNLRKMVMDSHDRESVITWLDLANKKLRRIDKIEYTSATFPGVTVRKQFSYTLVGNEYVRTSPGVWSIV